MIIVLSLMLAGMIIGAIFSDKKKFISIVDKYVNWAIYALIFLLGISIGLNKTIVNNLDSIGIKSLAITFGAVLGSILFALVAYKIFFKKTEKSIDNKIK